MEGFRELGLSEITIKALEKKGFEAPTPIQKKTIPLILKTNKDFVGQAQTGTGKTAAFGLPVLELIDEKKKDVSVLILTPTRELAIQVAEELSSLKGKRKLKIVPIYGGQSIENQIRSLKRGVDIVVGTPGRVMDHIRRKTLKLDKLDFVILDEADEMLNMGFVDDVEEILNYCNGDRRTFLFSATMPKEILRIAEKYMNDYDKIIIEDKRLTTDLTEQIYFEVEESDKFELLCRIIDAESDFYGLVFCRTKNDTDNVANKLIERGYDAEALHGDISQFQRERILKKFKMKRTNILVATDVAARGIDINDLTHVINYSLPQDPERYVHRIGRTGRAGKQGTAITFVTPNEYRRLVYIKKIANADIKKEKIPQVKDIIEKKRESIKERIKNLIEAKEYKKYLDFSQELLDEYYAEDIIAALLKHLFQDELDEASYREIKEPQLYKKGKCRLFVAKGKMDGMSPKKLVDFIKKESGVDDKRIRDVRVFEKFSFISVPFKDAEVILGTFKNNKKFGRRSIVEKAKKK